MAAKSDKRCVILGGCGFLGSVVARRLVAGGWNVRVFDKEGADLSRLSSVLSDIELVQGDFMNLGDLTSAIRDQPSVLHFVGTTIPQTSMNDIQFDVETNVLPTVRLLEILRRNSPVRLVFASSGGTVYGETDRRAPIPETHATEPISAYGISKLMVEKYIRLFSFNYRLSAVVMRFANPYGESQIATRPQGAVSAFVHRVRNGEPIHIWGDGSVVRDYVYQEDLASAVESVLNHPGITGTFNVGTGRGTSLNELVELIGRTFGVRPSVVRKESRSFDVPYNVLDAAKLTAASGWRPAISLEEGLRRMKSGSA